MVIGHSACPVYLNDIIYSFHMPFFFFISGYLFNPSYVYSAWNGLKHKVISLYFPFVKYSLLFLLFHNLFVHLGFYPTNNSLSENSIFHFYDYIERGFNIIFRMTRYDLLLSPFWFIRTLLLSNIITISFLFIINKLGFKIQRGIQTLLFISFLLLFLLLKYDWVIPVILLSKVDMFALFFFLLGFFIKQSSFECKINELLIFLFFIFLLSPLCCSFNMLFLDINTFYIFILFASIGILLTFYAAGYLSHFYTFQKILVYIGDRTMYILTFHLLSFKLLSYFLVKYCNEDISISIFPVDNTNNSYHWILYSFWGVLFPLFLENCSHLITSKIKYAKLK